MSGSKQQVLVIHGGNAFEKYDDYISYLKSKDVDLESLNSSDWKRNLAHDLGDRFQVLNPQMPNSQNARYVEWEIWFGRMITLLDDGVILVGHSLGGIFLAKYLSENASPLKIKASLLVAAPYNSPTQHPLVDFNIMNDLTGFEAQGGRITLFHSTDDFVVPYDNTESYLSSLPDAELVTFKDRNHFLQPEFPELVEKIKRLG